MEILTKSKESKNIQVYTPRIIEEIPTLQFLKTKRLDNEAYEQQKLEDSVKVLLDKLGVYLSCKNEIDAKRTLQELTNNIVRVKKLSIKERYETLQKKYLKLQND